MRLRCFWMLTMLLFTLPGAALPNTRSQALAVFQEGWFQETGIGDFKTAARQYETLVRQYPQFRDLQAAALYRLGGIKERLGRTEEAQDLYRQIVGEYAEQTSAARNAGRRLAAIAAGQPQVVPLPEEAPLTPAPLESPSPAPAPAASAWAAIGFHTYGLHAQWGSSAGHGLELIAGRKPENEWLAGLQGVYRLPAVETSLFQPYVGLGWEWFLHSSRRSIYAATAFGGLDYVGIRSWRIGADLGYQYVNRTGESSSHISTQPVVRLHVTWVIWETAQPLAGGGRNE